MVLHNKFNKSQAIWALSWLLALFLFSSRDHSAHITTRITYCHLLTSCILQWCCTMSHLCRAAALLTHRNHTEMSRLNHTFDLLRAHTAAVPTLTHKVGKLQACCRGKVPGRYSFYRYGKQVFLKRKQDSLRGQHCLLLKSSWLQCPLCHPPTLHKHGITWLVSQSNQK